MELFEKILKELAEIKPHTKIIGNFANQRPEIIQKFGLTNSMFLSRFKIRIKN